MSRYLTCLFYLQFPSSPLDEDLFSSLGAVQPSKGPVMDPFQVSITVLSTASEAQPQPVANTSNLAAKAALFNPAGLSISL